jgi:hypothetical protein
MLRATEAKRLLKRQQLPCFSCAEMHQMSNFYSPKLNQPLPQCIVRCRMWCCACNSVTAREVQSSAQRNPACKNDMRDLFDPCGSCHDEEGLSCSGSVVDGAPMSFSIVHANKFQVPHIGLDATVLARAIAAAANASFYLSVAMSHSLTRGS